jgi:catechol 2,3-dioxygenase-like lactoylglutathione lyase family enzyme
MLRLRQVVVVAADLDATVARLRDELALGEPYNDPAVDYFGLVNAVFAVGDTFIEVVSPTRPDASAARLLERRGGDGGYMLMFQVDDVAAARGRARTEGVREVFEVELDDIAEAHLHPSDMTGAIVSISAPEPPESWRWGGAGWRERSVPGGVLDATVAVADPAATAQRWERILGAPPADAGVELVADPAAPGLTEIRLAGDPARDPVEIAGVRFRSAG